MSLRKEPFRNNVDMILKIFDTLSPSLTCLLQRLCSNVDIWLTPPTLACQRNFMIGSNCSKELWLKSSRNCKMKISLGFFHVFSSTGFIIGFFNSVIVFLMKHFTQLKVRNINFPTLIWYLTFKNSNLP